MRRRPPLASHECGPFLLPERITGLPYIGGRGRRARRLDARVRAATLPRRLSVHRPSASDCSTASCLSWRTIGSSGFRRMISS